MMERMTYTQVDPKNCVMGERSSNQWAHAKVVCFWACRKYMVVTETNMQTKKTKLLTFSGSVAKPMFALEVVSLSVNQCKSRYLI